MAVVHVVLAWIMRAPGLAWGEDDAAYIQLGRQLRHLSYRDIHDIAAPIHARFPPGYPLVIALLGWPFGDSVDWLIALNTLCAVATIVLLFLAARRYLGSYLALLLAALFALNPTTLSDSGQVMAESAFKFLTMLGIWALAREDDGGRFSLLAAAAIIAAALTRSAGVVLLPALVAYWVMQRRYRNAILLVAALVVTVGVWLAWTFMAPDPENNRLYVADMGLGGTRRSRFAFISEILARLPNRSRRLFTIVFPYALAFPIVAGTVVDNIAWLIVLVAIGAVGLIVLLRRWSIASLFALSYGALLLVWRYAVERFANPIVPFLHAALLVGCDQLAERFAPRRRAAIVGGLAGLLLLGTAQSDLRFLRRMLRCDRSAPARSAGCWNPQYRAYLQAAQWVRDSTPADAVFFVNKERGFYQHSGRKTVNQDRTLKEDPDSLAGYLRSRGVHYSVAVPVGILSEHHNDLLARACHDFIVLKALPEQTFVLRLKDPSETPGDETACRALAPYRHSSPPAE